MRQTGDHGRAPDAQLVSGCLSGNSGRQGSTVKLRVCNNVTAACISGGGSLASGSGRCAGAQLDVVTPKRIREPYDAAPRRNHFCCSPATSPPALRLDSLCYACDYVDLVCCCRLWFFDELRIRKSILVPLTPACSHKQTGAFQEFPPSKSRARVVLTLRPLSSDFTKPHLVHCAHCP
jgi:hypothetical protein